MLPWASHLSRCASRPPAGGAALRERHREPWPAAETASPEALLPRGPRLLRPSGSQARTGEPARLSRQLSPTTPRVKRCALAHARKFPPGPGTTTRPTLRRPLAEPTREPCGPRCLPATASDTLTPSTADGNHWNHPVQVQTYGLRTVLMVALSRQLAAPGRLPPPGQYPKVLRRTYEVRNRSPAGECGRRAPWGSPKGPRCRGTECPRNDVWLVRAPVPEGPGVCVRRGGVAADKGR